MKYLALFSLLITSAFLNLIPSLQATLPPIVPMEDFFRNPVETGHQLSPTGETIAFLKPWKNRLNIYIQGNKNKEAKRLTSSRDRDIRSYFWKTDDILIFSQDKGGDENYQPYSINRITGEIKHLIDFPETKVRIVDDLERIDEDHILVSHNHRNKEIFDLYKLNILTGQSELLIKNPGDYLRYVTDHNGKVRIAYQSDGINITILYRKTEKDPFTQLITTNFRDSFDPLFFTYDNENLFIASNLSRDKTAIILYNPERKETIKTIYKHPEVDVEHLIRSDQRQRITGVTYYTDKLHIHFLDKKRREIQERLEFQLPNIEVRLINFNRDETKALVRTFSDRDRGAYYFYDVERNKLEKIVDLSPWINPDHMAEMKPVSFKSRDGLTLHGYLTLPTGIPKKNLPIIINPHGGPSARDYWGFAPEIQFLANRGYGVLQINFRGSTGYGKHFWQAGFKEWGRKMQDDLTDGALWLIKQGIADPKAIGIYGASYGGYATLAGLTFTPDLYACGVDYVGISNIFTMLNSDPPYWKPFLEIQYEIVGHPEKDKELLTEISPVFHVNKIKAPLLVAQGANDPRVKQAESDQIVEALRKRKVDVKYILKDNEGHGFHNEENRFDFYRAMEEFLYKHLGGRIETTTPANSNSAPKAIETSTHSTQENTHSDT